MAPASLDSSAYSVLQLHDDYQRWRCVFSSHGIILSAGRQHPVCIHPPFLITGAHLCSVSTILLINTLPSLVEQRAWEWTRMTHSSCDLSHAPRQRPVSSLPSKTSRLPLLAPLHSPTQRRSATAGINRSLSLQTTRT
jgi:hypothetical protein